MNEIISWYVFPVNCHVHLVAFPVPALPAVSQDIQQLQIQQKKTTAETTATTPKQTSITTTRTFTTIGVECEGEGIGEGIMVKAQEEETETKTETEGVQISFSFCFSSQGFGSQCLLYLVLSTCTQPFKLYGSKLETQFFQPP